MGHGLVPAESERPAHTDNDVARRTRIRQWVRGLLSKKEEDRGGDEERGEGKKEEEKQAGVVPERFSLSGAMPTAACLTTCLA